MDEQDLLKRIETVHLLCHNLLKNTLKKLVPVSGNIGIFCQSKKEFDTFQKIKNILTEISDNPKQKYFKLKKPIIINQQRGIPKTTYTHLYIRQVDPSDYGKNLGDVDFILSDEEYTQLKSKILGNKIKGASMYDRPGWDTIQITEPSIKAVAYISTKSFAEKVRIKFD